MDVPELQKYEEQRTRLMKDGFDRIKESDFEAAAAIFKEVVSIDPEDPVAQMFAAACFAETGRGPEAEAFARKAITLAPLSAFSHYVLAIALLANGEEKEAESRLWDAVAVEPHSAFARVELARMLIAGSRHTEAMRQVEEALRLSPDNAEALFFSALGQVLKQEIEAAATTLERVIELEPTHDRAFALYGAVLMIRADRFLTTPPKLEDYRKATNVLSMALHLNPQLDFARHQIKLAEDAVARISTPTTGLPKEERWYHSLLKQLAIWGGYAVLTIGVFALMCWLDSRGSDFLVGVALMLGMELGAFLIMLYIKRDFSALPPSLYDLGRRFSKSKSDSDSEDNQGREDNRRARK